MAKTIILVAAHGESISSTVMAQIRAEHGPEALILTESEAKAQGVLPKSLEFSKRPEFELPVLKPDFYQDTAKSDCRKGWKK
jgi:hypothetical protein